MKIDSKTAIVLLSVIAAGLSAYFAWRAETNIELSELKGDVVDLTTDVVDLTTDVVDLTTDVDKLESNVNVLESGPPKSYHETIKSIASNEVVPQVTASAEVKRYIESVTNDRIPNLNEQLAKIKSQLTVTITQCRICFREIEGSTQCQLNRDSCSGWSLPDNTHAWTKPFRDDTDKRAGGCKYLWRLECK